MKRNLNTASCGKMLIREPQLLCNKYPSTKAAPTYPIILKVYKMRRAKTQLIVF